MNLEEIKKIEMLAQNVVKKLELLPEKNLIEALYSWIGYSIDKKVSTKKEYFTVILNISRQYIFYVPKNLKKYEERNIYIKCLYVMFKYLHYPIKQKDIEIKQEIMYQASEEKRENFKEEDFCADVFLCAFLYNDYQFEEIMESVYSEKEKTYDFITLSNITHIKIEILKLRAARLGLIKKTA